MRGGCFCRTLGGFYERRADISWLFCRGPVVVAAESQRIDVQSAYTHKHTHTPTCIPGVHARSPPNNTAIVTAGRNSVATAVRAAAASATRPIKLYG